MIRDIEVAQPDELKAIVSSSISENREVREYVSKTREHVIVVLGCRHAGPEERLTYYQTAARLQ